MPSPPETPPAPAGPSADDTATAPGWHAREIAVVVAAAIGGALLLLGPVLGSGSLFLLDTVALPDPPLPRGFFGLGPEIPRSTPFDLFQYLVSVVTGGPLAVKLLMAAALVTAAVGMYRLVRSRGVLVAASAAVLYAGSPFLATRLVAGQISGVIAAALLPWVLPLLARVPVDLGAVFLGTVVLSLTGSYGGILAALVAGCALLLGRDLRRLAKGVAVVAAGCSIWLVPGVIVMVGAPRLVSSSSFPSGTDSVGEVPELFAGHGFWQELYQVGREQPFVWIVGLVLLGLGVVGHRRLPDTWRGALGLAAAITMVLSIAPAVPGLDSLFDAFTDTPIGAPFREPQRYLALYLCWMAAAAPLGAQHLARTMRAGVAADAVRMAPLALGVLLLAPALWGLAPFVRPADVPTTWQEVRAEIREGGGTTFVLPWARYFSLRFAAAPRAINPMPRFLGTDVIVSSDLGLSERNSTEGIDPREAMGEDIAARLEQRIVDGVEDDLRALGVRWLLLLHDGGYERYVLGLERLGIEPTVQGADATLYELPGDRLDGVTPDGEPVDVDARGNVTADVDTSSEFTWFRGYQPGWLRGFSGVGEAENGLMAVPSGGMLWYWPALLVLLTDLAVAVGVVRCVRARRRSPSGAPATDQ